LYIVSEATKGDNPNNDSIKKCILMKLYVYRMLVMRRTFKKLDSDGSGFLTRDEILNAASSEAEVDVKSNMISDMLLALIKDDDKKVNDRLID
jgi:hypothetical protein